MAFVAEMLAASKVQTTERRGRKLQQIWKKQEKGMICMFTTTISNIMGSSDAPQVHHRELEGSKVEIPTP